MKNTTPNQPAAQRKRRFQRPSGIAKTGVEPIEIPEVQTADGRPYRPYIQLKDAQGRRVGRLNIPSDGVTLRLLIDKDVEFAGLHATGFGIGFVDAGIEMRDLFGSGRYVEDSRPQYRQGQQWFKVAYMQPSVTAEGEDVVLLRVYNLGPDYVPELSRDRLSHVGTIVNRKRRKLTHGGGGGGSDQGARAPTSAPAPTPEPAATRPATRLTSAEDGAAGSRPQHDDVIELELDLDLELARIGADAAPSETQPEPPQAPTRPGMVARARKRVSAA